MRTVCACDLQYYWEDREREKFPCPLLSPQESTSNFYRRTTAPGLRALWSCASIAGVQTLMALLEVILEALLEAWGGPVGGQFHDDPHLQGTDKRG